MAHGLTARADLPLPRWLFGWRAAVVLIISFLALAVLWPKPKLEHAGSRPLPGSRLLTSRPVDVVCGAIGVAVLLLVIHAGFAGEQSPSSNIAPVIVFVTFWVGFVPVSVVFGNVFAAFNPRRAIGRVAFRTARRRPDRAAAAAGGPAEAGGAAGHDDGMAEAGFYQHVGQAFRDLAGALGAGDVWQAQIAAFLGLICSIAAVLVLYLVGCVGASLIDRSTTPTSVANSFAHSLVPIAFAYVSAHSFTFLLFQGQTIVPLASDPLGHGSDLFGTAGLTIDYNLIGAAGVWYIQVILVVVGHSLALALAHDRALILYATQRDAVRSQFWMLGVMVAFTSLALFLLSQANA